MRWAVLVLMAATGCRPGASPPASPPGPAGPAAPSFSEVARELGVAYSQTCPPQPLTILQATGSGCGFLDADGDGRLDLFAAGQPRCALFRNTGAGFEEITEAAGVGRKGFWTACAAADYDGDGDTDLYVSGFNTAALYRNRGDGTFEDVTRSAGILQTGYQTSAAWGDVDRDGRLDLYVCRYVEFSPSSSQLCPHPNAGFLRTCGPDAYPAQLGVLYRNLGSGRFEDATRRLGLATAHGKAWGAAFGDFNDDGWPDLYVANDEMPGDLFLNERGRFRNVGESSGTAYSRDGGLHGGMGVDWADYDNDGRLDLAVSTFWGEVKPLYHNDGGGLFSEVSTWVGAANATRNRVGFGVRLADFDNSGDPDLFFVNGHVQDNSQVSPEEQMAQLPQLLLADGNGRFVDVSARAGPALQEPLIGRGAAFADWDNDGDIDVAAMDLNGPLRLYRNEGTPSRRSHWFEVRALAGPRSTDALGARITVEAGGRRQMREVQTGGSVLASNDPRAHFGLGGSAAVDKVRVRWPNGRTEEFPGGKADRLLVIRQRPGTGGGGQP